MNLTERQADILNDVLFRFNTLKWDNIQSLKDHLDFSIQYRIELEEIKKLVVEEVLKFKNESRYTKKDI